MILFPLLLNYQEAAVYATRSLRAVDPVTRHAADLVWLFPCRCAAKPVGVKILTRPPTLPIMESVSEITRVTGVACFAREDTVYAARCVKDARAVSNG